MLAQNIKNLVNKIPHMDDNKLLKLFLNAQRQKLRGNPDAIYVIDSIQSEWRSRLEKAKNGDYKATMPDKGMLATFGYHVGLSGEPKKFRLEILRTIFTSDLPVVGSPAYTLEWGERLSRTRFLKMRKTLIGLIENNRRYGTRMEQAINDWLGDLEYIDTEIKNLIRQ